MMLKTYYVLLVPSSPSSKLDRGRLLRSSARSSTQRIPVHTVGTRSSPAALVHVSVNPPNHLLDCDVNSHLLTLKNHRGRESPARWQTLRRPVQTGARSSIGTEAPW